MKAENAGSEILLPRRAMTPVPPTYDDTADDGVAPDRNADSPVTRPRGWVAAAAAAGFVAGAALIAAAILPPIAPYIAALAVFGGVAIGAILMHRARDREILTALAGLDEDAADDAWLRRDVMEHYRVIAEGKRLAETASAAKSGFLATVSHEMRTPLSGILGLADTLMETELDAEQETFVRAARNSGELMLGLIDDMLDFAKIESGRFELAPTRTDLEALLEDVAELLFARAEAKGLDLATYADPALPARILVDSARLRQVLINLVGNALKFTESGGVAVTAAPNPAVPQQIEFRVEDTGPGIPEGEAERIFDEHAQAVDDQQYRVAGSGLGLAIAQRIVKEMGGAITAAPRSEGGTVFAFSLAVEADNSATMERIDLTGKRVLIAGSASPASALLARHLTDWGATVRIADGMTQAAALAGAAAAAMEGYDLLLLDEHAVSETGAALATIREAAGGTLPAAVIIPPGRHGVVDQRREEGFNAYLVRPVRRQSLGRIARGLADGAADFGRDSRDEAPAPRKRPRAGRRLNVLVAEDDPINALLIRSMLQRLNHDVTEVSDGETALRHLLSTPFDVALLDLSLPARDGLAIAATVVAARAGAPIPCRLIAVTADIRPETRDQAIAAGFDDFAVKPLGLPGLLELLQRGDFENRAA